MSAVRPDSSSQPALSYPGLIAPRVLRQTPHQLAGEGLWGDGREPCWFVACIGDLRDNPALASMRVESQILARLADVPGVPRLLHIDIGAGLMLRSRAPDTSLRDLPSPTFGHPRRGIELCLALLAILERVHEAGIFHGNISPDSIAIDTSSSVPGWPITLVDFSHATAQSHVEAERRSAVHSMRLQPFSAPEQTGRMARAADYRVDYYALGALLYWSLTGKPPFSEADPLALLHALLTRLPPPLAAPVPSNLSAVVLKLLAKQPEDRYQSAHGLRADLRTCLAGLAPVADRAAFQAPFEPGRADHRTRPVQPSRLFGREAEIAGLSYALLMPPKLHRVVMIRGFAGAGKSALVRAMQPLLAERGGIVASGKFDAYQRLTPFESLATALGDVARYWLSEPPKRLERVRTQLLESLGPNAAFLAHVAPSFAPLLAVSPEAGAEAANPHERMRQALASVFAALRASGTPMLLFIDDLQFADADSLQWLRGIALEESHGEVLLVGAYRDNEIDATHPLATLSSQIRAAGVDLIDVAIDGLPDDTVRALLADVLDADADAIAPLAFALHRKTRGNVFFVLQSLRRLFDAGHLRRPDGSWQWDVEAVEALPNSQNMIAGLLDELQHMPHELQTLAGICACLGGTLEPDTLAEVLGLPPEHIDGLLMPLIQRDFMLAVQPAHTAATGRSRHLLRFCHDRMRQAAHALLSAGERERWHLGIARVLARRRSDDSNDSDRFDAADHYLTARALIIEATERRQVSRRLAQAAQAALSRGAFQTALRFIDGAQSLAMHVDTDDAQLGLQIDVTRHGILCSLARTDEADRLFERVFAPAQRESPSIVPAITRQIVSLSTRGNHEAAVRLGLDRAAALGIAVPAEGEWQAALEHETRSLQISLEAEGAAAYETLPPMTDARRIGAGLMLVSIEAAASSWRPDVSRWVRLSALRLAREHGHFPSLPLAMSTLTPFCHPHEDYAAGYQLARAGLRLFARYPVAELAPALHHLNAIAVMHWFEPLERCAEAAREACRLAVDIGDTEHACLSQLTLQAVAVDNAAHLDELEQVATAALQMLQRTGNRQAVGSFRVFRQFAHAMRGDSASPGSFDDPDDGEADHLAVTKNPIAKAYFTTYRALSAALYGDWTLALQHARAASHLREFVAGHYVTALQRWLQALALCQALRFGVPNEREPLLQELAPLAAWLEQRAAQAPMNFRHLWDLLRALRAWDQDDIETAAEAFAAAIGAARQQRRPWQHALAQELAAEFHAAQGAARLARSHRLATVQAYEAWGAAGKARQLRTRQGGFEPSARPHRGEAGGPDVDGLLLASQALAREYDPRRVLSSFVSLVRRYAAAERGVLLWDEGDGRWSARAAFSPKSERIRVDFNGALDPQGAAQVPAPILRYLTQSLQPLMLQDVPQDPRFGQDPMVRRNGLKSVIGLPIQHRGRTVGLLYLENRLVHTALATPHLESLRWVGLQFSFAYENARVREQIENTPDAPLLFENRPFALGDVTGELAQLIGPQADDKGLELLFIEPPELPPTLIGDTWRLTQVLVNLGHNAVRFTDRGEVIVAIEELQRRTDSVLLRFSVSDTGVGLDEEQRRRLLRKPLAGSTPLRAGGFAVSRHLIDLMGGELDVRSAPGEGCSVRFSLRLGLQDAVRIDHDSEATAPGLPSGLPGAHRPARVLVVDDNVTARNIIVNMTRSIGLPVEEAGDGWAALRAVSRAAIAQKPFDLVLLDWKMPGMDGVECARQLRDIPHEHPLKIVMMTAANRDQVAARLSSESLAVGAVLAKPVTASTLFDTYSSTLGGGTRIERRSARRDTDPASRHEALRGARVLLVEDNAINRELALDLLHDAGLTVSTAADGREAIDVLSQHRFDLVLMDCEMPTMDGFSATREIRRHPRWRELPIIAMSANTRPGDRQRALAAGMSDHILKPIDVRAMFDTLTRWHRPARLTRGDGKREISPAISADALTGLPGIDARAGRARTLGNDRLYRRLLLMFRSEQQDFVAQFTAARQRGDNTSAALLLHTLRTAAGSLGAVALEQACHAIEDAASRPRNEVVDAALLSNLKHSLATVLDGLDTLEHDAA